MERGHNGSEAKKKNNIKNKILLRNNEATSLIWDIKRKRNEMKHS